jgi:protein-L-isoaspartate O-methyltransferase
LGVSFSARSSYERATQQRSDPLRRCVAIAHELGHVLGLLAPFDAIIVAAAFPAVPPPLVDQARAGGRLVQPIGPGGAEDVRLFERDGNRLLLKRSLTGARFVPLCGEHARTRSSRHPQSPER